MSKLKLGSQWRWQNETWTVHAIALGSHAVMWNGFRHERWELERFSRMLEFNSKRVAKQLRDSLKEARE